MSSAAPGIPGAHGASGARETPMDGAGDPLRAQEYLPGVRVRVTQKIARPRESQSISFEGVIVRFGQQKTGSWFAHAKDDRLWLDRLELRKDDGEIVVCNLDRYSRVERLG